MKLVDKDTIVAEIEKRLNANGSFDEFGDETWFEENCWLAAYKSILSFINTLETKEVDLDREIRRYRMRNPIIQHREESLYDYMANVAKHFFKLGLNAKKKE